MAKVKILNNSMNPRGWNIGDEVEIKSGIQLDMYKEVGAVQVLEEDPPEPKPSVQEDVQEETLPVQKKGK